MNRTVLVGFKFLLDEKKKKFALNANKENAQAVFEAFKSDIEETYIRPRVNGDDDISFSLLYVEKGEEVELERGLDLHLMLEVEPPVENVVIDIHNYKGMIL